MCKDISGERTSKDQVVSNLQQRLVYLKNETAMVCFVRNYCILYSRHMQQTKWYLQRIFFFKKTKNKTKNKNKKTKQNKTKNDKWVGTRGSKKVKVNFRLVNTGRCAHFPFKSNWARLIFRCLGLATPPPQRACYLPSIAGTHYMHLGREA